MDYAPIIAIAGNDIIKKSEAVIWLEGDGLARMAEVVRIYKAQLADCIVATGGMEAARPFTIPAAELAEELYKIGIPKDKVIVENTAQNTYEQGIEVMKIAAQIGWRKIILVASHFHQARAYLTFLQAMVKANLKIQIFNSPAKDLSWFEAMATSKSRYELFEDELKKMDEYIAKGHICSIPDALAYQEWKEKQS